MKVTFSWCILLFQMASKNGRKSPQDDPSVIPDSQDVQEIHVKDIHSKYSVLLRAIYSKRCKDVNNIVKV